jgi:hypothetical protein
VELKEGAAKLEAEQRKDQAGGVGTRRKNATLPYRTTNHAIGVLKSN